MGSGSLHDPRLFEDVLVCLLDSYTTVEQDRLLHRNRKCLRGIVETKGLEPSTSRSGGLALYQPQRMLQCL